jgi:hypothetical protein
MMNSIETVVESASRTAPKRAWRSVWQALSSLSLGGRDSRIALAGCLVVMGLVAAPARAGMIVLTQSFGTASSPIGVPSLQPISLSFARFDTSQGTLTSVQVQIVGNASVSAFVRSQQSQDQTVNQLIAGVGLDLTDLSSNLLSSVNAEVTLVNSPTTILGLSTRTFGLQSTTASDSETYTSGSELTEFIGTNPISLSLDDGAFASIIQAPFGQALLFGPSAESVYGSVSITYTFATATVAPEPASASLIESAIGGMLGLGLLRRSWSRTP